MVDEIFDRTYQQGRGNLNNGIDSLFAGIASEFGKSLRAMHRIEWSAPWATYRNGRSA